MNPRADDRITDLTARISALEGDVREKNALAKVHKDALEDLKVQMKEIDERVHTIQRAVDVIQTRMAMWTAVAALAGAVLGEVIVRIATTLVN